MGVSFDRKGHSGELFLELEHRLIVTMLLRDDYEASVAHHLLQVDNVMLRHHAIATIAERHRYLLC